MNDQTAALTERQHYWLKHLRACEATGQGMKAYALSHNLDVKDLYDGKKSLVKKGILPRTRTPRFQRAEVVGTQAAKEWRVQLPNGVTVAFFGAVDGGTLATVLNTAAAVA